MSDSSVSLTVKMCSHSLGLARFNYECRCSVFLDHILDRTPEMSAKKSGTFTQNENGKEKKTFVCQPWPKNTKC